VTYAIALVDDDRNITTSVSILLESEGFDVHTWHDGAEALRGMSETHIDLAILDIKMPRMDGMELLENLRKTSVMPVIFLTSKDDEIDEILGLRMGADDYIKKPFSQRLLLERIRTLLRRVEARNAALSEATADDAPSESAIVRGSLVLDPARHMVAWKGKAVDLTVTGFLIIQALAQRLGHVKSRDQLGEPPLKTIGSMTEENSMTTPATGDAARRKDRFPLQEIALVTGSQNRRHDGLSLYHYSRPSGFPKNPLSHYKGNTPPLGRHLHTKKLNSTKITTGPALYICPRHQARLDDKRVLFSHRHFPLNERKHRAPDANIQNG
jgi:two-component system response regulator ChvI